MELASDTIDVLMRRDWPGNVRELENVIHRGVSLATESVIYPKDLFLDHETIDTGVADHNVRNASEPQAHRVSESLGLRAGLSVSEMERKLIHLTLEQTSGNRTRAADLLGISLRTLRNKLREYRQEGVALTGGLG